MMPNQLIEPFVLNIAHRAIAYREIEPKLSLAGAVDKAIQAMGDPDLHNKDVETFVSLHGQVMKLLTRKDKHAQLPPSPPD